MNLKIEYKTKEYYDFDALLYDCFHGDKELLEAYIKKGKIFRTEYGTFKVMELSYNE